MNLSRRPFLWIAAAALLRTAAVLAADPAPLKSSAAGEAVAPERRIPAWAFDPKDADTVVFLGDSITHDALYTQFVEDFFYTRHPSRRLHFYNAGVGGDVAGDGLDRFDTDVAQFHPRYVTVLFGMNDGKYRSFDPEIFARYQGGMKELLDRITALGATAIPMGPSMFDPYGNLRRWPNGSFNRYYDGVLALYGAWLREEAFERGLGFVDMHEPLERALMLGRRSDANYALSRDGVHPNPVGHALMAAALIGDTGSWGDLSDITLTRTADGRFDAQTGGGGLSELRAEGRGLRFVYRAFSLPWVLPPEAAAGLRLADCGHRFNREEIAVRRLTPGRYELRIQGEAVGIYSDDELAAGVNLEGNERTPQYRRALGVALLNQKRNKLFKQLGDLRYLRQAFNGKKTPPPDWPGAGKTRDELKAVFPAWRKATFDPEVARLLSEADGIEGQIYAANKIPPLVYELVFLR